VIRRSHRYSLVYANYINSVFELVFRNLSFHNEAIAEDIITYPFLVVTKKGIRQKDRRRSVKTEPLDFEGVKSVLKNKKLISEFLESRKDIDLAFPPQNADGSGYSELADKPFTYNFPEPKLIFLKEGKVELLGFEFIREYGETAMRMLMRESSTNTHVYKKNTKYLDMDYYYTPELLGLMSEALALAEEKVNADISFVEKWIEERKADLIHYSTLLVI
jgi:hypothetical protein